LNDRVEVVLSEDPGAASDHLFNKKLDNVNRQIVSTSSGLRSVKTEYVIKSRTDIVFTSDRILDYFDRWKGNAEWFEEKILSVNYNFKHPDSGILFHPSDLVLLGRSKDLKSYFNCSLRSKEHSRWLEGHNPPRIYHNYYKNLLTVHSAESYLLSEYLKKSQKFSGPVEYLETCFTLDKSARKFWSKAIPKNFIVVDPFRLGLRFYKYPYREFKSFHSLTYIQWRNMQKSELSNGMIDLELILYSVVKILYKFLGKNVKPEY
jgi:hypothetical protein